MRDSSGTKNEPQYAGTGAPQDAADLTEVASYAAFVGNRKVGPTTGTATGPGGANTGRTTSTGADVWEGLVWEDTTDGFTYKYHSGGWVKIMDDTGWVALTYASSWSDFSAGYSPLAVRRKNGIVYISGVGKGGAASAGTLLTTLPVGFRMGRQQIMAAIGSGGACSLEIFTDGSVKAGPGGVYATWTSLSISPFIAEG